jgi:hypothetical protein
MNDDARCGSKPARWRCRVFFTKELMLHEIPEEPARRGSHTSASLCLGGLTEKHGRIIPRTKSARARNAKKTFNGGLKNKDLCSFPAFSMAVRT